ncbi:MAG: 1-acyl-sn-glycerol-3-phosphate acyltransferase [Nitrospirae bacterium]|nr:1-acyl-sn-glycerol-3-phosphate acyltransferase [Nitrospirota bacterium]
MFYDVTCFFIGIFARLFFPLRIIGSENIPEEGGVIIAANHLSYLDIPLLGYSINKTRQRHADFMAKKELFAIPVIGFLFQKLSSFPIDREKVDRAGLREAVKRLRSGRMVAIYPEGTRSRDGRLHAGKPGVGMIVRMSGKKVVPAAIQGTDKALPPGRWLAKPTPVTIKFGRPLDFCDVGKGGKGGKEGNERESAEQITKVIMDSIAVLAESLSTPSSHPPSQPPLPPR